MASLLGATAKPFIDSFCDPRDTSGHFSNWLGPFTPCFTDVIVIGLAHAVGIVGAALTLRASLRASHRAKYRLLGAAGLGHAALAALCGLAFLIILIQLNARLASHALPFISGRAAPFEWASYTLSLACWGLYCAAFAVGAQRYDPGSALWRWKFPPLLILTGNLAKLRHSDERGDYFAVLFYLYVGLAAAIAALAMLHTPGESSLEVAVPGLEGIRPRSADYLPLSGEDDVCPEVRAGILSRLTFSWMNPLMRRGFRAPLTFADIWRLPPGDRAGSLDQRFGGLWAQERFRHPEAPSLVATLWRATAPLFLCAVPLKLLADAAQFTAPLSINWLLEAVSRGAPDRTGYLLTLGMLGGLLVGTLADNQHFQLTMRAGFRMRSMLTHAVYHKILFLSPDARARFSSGRLYSAIGSDVDTIQMLCQSILNLIGSPVRILVALTLLYVQLGVAAFAAVALLVMLMPVQGWLVQKQRAILRASLTATDERAKLEGELIAGMDVVKCYAWEESFLRRIRGVRDRELAMIWRAFLVASANTVITLAVPAAASVGAFGTYVLVSRKNLTPAQAFTSLSLLAVLRFPLANLPQLIASLVQASVALGRLREVLAAPERGEMELLPRAAPGEDAVVVCGDYSYSADAQPSLLDLDLHIRGGDLVAVVGATGSGKTSLLQAALGLMERSRGDEPRLRGRVALVPQAAFIVAGTVRDNVLFGRHELDEARYRAALSAAALEQDLASFPAGDLTEIGERGVTVSGGQKQRIAIARAVYANADVVLMDDPLSALDARVGRRVFRDAVVGALGPATRLLVTNQLQYVSAADRILWLGDGRVLEDGTYAELMARSAAFAAFMATAQTEGEEEEDEGKGGAEDWTVDEELVAGVDGVVEDTNTSSQDAPIIDAPGTSSSSDGQKPQNGAASIINKNAPNQKTTTTPLTTPPVQPAGQLVAEEGRSTGRVSWAVISGYVQALGGRVPVLLLLTSFAAVELARVGAQLWLQHWTNEVDRTGGATPLPTRHYLGVYAAVSLAQVLCTACSQFGSRAMSVRASRALHETLIQRLCRAPMSFFHTTPLGRIVNRLTKDVSEVDKNLADWMAFFLRSLLQLASTIALVGALNPFTLWALTPIVFAFLALYRYFQATVREVKRLDAVSRSPIYTSVGEALGGLATIRAYRAERRLLASTGAALDGNVVMSLASMSANRWLSVRLETLGALAAAAAALAAVEQRGAAALLGNILSSALQVTSLTNMTLRSASLAEVSFNSAERVIEYANPPQEAAAVVPRAAPHDWPSRGDLRFERVSLRYRPGLPLVLRGLSFHVPGGTSCGVVGRTGAGKSSLINALFRLVEAESGAIALDGVDIARVGLTRLRRAMSLIPQTPVLFTGTVRFNLAPFGGHSDAELWTALRHAHLAEALRALGPLGLDLELAEGGAPLSAGQRQLLALARALLRPSKVLVLDEATASVDVHTDALIQETVRREFKDCTVIAIAHRLQTVVDADNVLVMDAGRAAEFGPADELLRDGGGIFGAMVRETGAASERALRAAAAGVRVEELIDGGGGAAVGKGHSGVEGKSAQVSQASRPQDASPKPPTSKRGSSTPSRAAPPKSATLSPLASHPIREIAPSPDVSPRAASATLPSPRAGALSPRPSTRAHSAEPGTPPAASLGALSRELTTAAEAAAAQLHRALDDLDACVSGPSLQPDAVALQRALARATALVEEVTSLARRADQNVQLLGAAGAPRDASRWLGRTGDRDASPPWRDV